MESSIFRQLRLATFAFLTLIVVGMVVMGALTLRERQLLAGKEAELNKLYTFERTHIVIAQHIIVLRSSPDIDPAGQQEVLQEIDQLIVLSTSAESVRLVQSIRSRLPAIDAGTDREPLMELYQAVIIEREHGSQVLADLEADTETQLRLELAAPLAILAVGLLLLPMARRRIIKPLDDFGRQLGRLADGKFTPAPLDEVDDFLLPLHQQFNQVARRLHELEQANRARTESLEAEVRTTTRALFEQQRSLAHAERLAATGELAASVAHELRNPLAGIQMTLANLRRELGDPDMAERVDLVLAEVGRLTRLLNDLLDTARHAPEPARPVQLAALVDDLLALTRCQLPSAPILEHRIDRALICRLPQDRLRQALLNLILNSGAALAERGGTIGIAAAVDAGRLRITVADDGPGFPADLLARGIRPFFSTREQGTGLGLALVRRFARDLGGEVELRNSEPHGAEVTMVLPAQAD